MVTRMFEAQLGKNLEAYIDDMVVKRVRTYVIHLLGTYVIILCSWLII